MHDFTETNGASCLAALPVLAVAAIIPVEGRAFPLIFLLLQALLLFTALGMLIANQCHRWAHTDPARLGPLVRRMQRLGLVLPPRQHRLHHVRPFDSYYCTASGWLNATLNAIGFFRVLERLITRATGTHPRHDSMP
jgi:TMEM189-like protein